MLNLYIKTRVHSGNRGMEILQSMKDKRILIVCDKFLSTSGAISYLTDVLNTQNEVIIFDGAIPDPSIEVVAKGISIICKMHPDIVIGFGGGSAIDTAKGILYFAKAKNLIQKPRFITVPTTSGTGSEVTQVAVITDTESQSKHLIIDDSILADDAILDAKLTLSIPPTITANTGMDVLTHALEAYVSTGANACSDALSEKAVELLLKSLVSCYQDGKNLAARSLMHEASTLAGMAFNIAGLGMNHSIAHQLGGTFHIPHGLANALLLNQVIDYNCANHDVMRKYAAMAYKVQLADRLESPEYAVNSLKVLIKELMRCMNMPTSIRALDIKKDAYEQQLQNMIANALIDNCLASTPREVGAEAIRVILLKIYE